MRAVFVVTVLVTMLAGLPLPEVGSVPPNAVPYATIEQLALRKAAAEWPGCRLGAVIPYVDEDGATVAYMFHFRTDGQEFPADEQVVQDIRTEQEGLNASTDLMRWRSKYSHLLVSARYDRPPIVCYGYGTSEFYALSNQGLARARSRLGPDARLTRIYFIWPGTFLEFANGAGQHVIYSRHFERTWDSRKSFQREAARTRAGDDAGLTAHFNQEWHEALTRDYSQWTAVFVPEVDRAPFYDWSYGCSPTSGAMVLGYLDRVHDYGRLVDWYWQRWDMVEGEWDKQIPNVQRECALAMNTDTTNGGTSIWNIGPGLAEVGSINGYYFDMVNEMGSSGNDWAWSTVTAEIDAGYAFEWSATWEIHSLAAFGYRTPEKDIYVHNTWWAPAEWWHYSGNGWSNVASPHPSSGDPHKLELVYPKGDTNYNSIGRGEVLQVGDTVNVTWNNFGNPAQKVKIELSRDAGKTWQDLDSVDDNGLYRWYIAPSLPACESVRLRFRQWFNGELTSADGSFGCFRLVKEPVPPTPLAPPNGQQIFNPPVVLLVDTTLRNVDSFAFRVVYGTTDTIWREKGTVPRCSLPDTLFTYGRSYKWVCKAHNRFGWGDFGTPWTFWVRFHPGVEEKPPVEELLRFAVKSVNRKGQGSVRFQLRVTSPDARLAIYDATGKLVREFTGLVSGGFFWDMRDQAGQQVSPGLYFGRLIDGQTRLISKLVLVD